MLNLTNLNTLANIVQLLSYQELMEQATADDIMQVLHHSVAVVLTHNEAIKCEGLLCPSHF